jgi:hypothetical protein
MNGRTSARSKTAGKQTAQGGGENVEQQIKALHAQLMDATLKHDPGFLEKYLADDYMAIRNDGKVTTRFRRSRIIGREQLNTNPLRFAKQRCASTETRRSIIR